MSKLREMYMSTPGRYMCKFPHYMDIYDEWFTPFIDKEITILEVGCGVGGFLQLCKAFFGPKAKIYGIDKREEFVFEESQIKVFSGFTKDKPFLKSVADEIGKIDILVDDASHEYNDQVITFETFLPNLNVENSLYCCEDLMIAYWANYSNPSYIGYLVKMIDKINTNNIVPVYHSLHFYSYLAILKISLEPNAYSSPMGVGKPLEYYLPDGENNERI